MESKQIPFAYSFNVETPSQLIDIMTDQGVYLPMDVSLNQMANIRFIILTHHLRQIPFDIIKINDFWFIEKVFHHDLNDYLKQGDRLLIINKTMISDQLQEIDIFKLILYSSIPFIIWVTWDIDTFLKYQTIYRQYENEGAYLNAKTYLLQTHHYNDISLYDHLAFIITNVIQNPQNNMNDLLEKLNQYVPYSILRPTEDNTKLAMTKIHARLLEGKQRDLLKSKDYMIKAVPYLMEMAYYCSNAGYGIHTTEIILIWSAMKRLNNEINCTEMKFWGKIFGLYCDYYIIQIQHEKEISFNEIDISNNQSRNRKYLSISKYSNHRIETKLNQEQEELSFEIPSEPHGIGTNQYTYFVTNSPGLSWIKLPDVKPIMIDYARKIRYLFTGCLSSKINGFPPYPGLEKDYLRAQIARITATTHISPAGYYILTDNGEEEEEMSFNNERKDPNIILNPEYNNDPTNIITTELLADTNLQEWVHTLPEILSQGRTHFWRPPTNLSQREEEEEEDKETLDRNSIEIPAPLLQPIGDDKFLHTNQTPWSIGLTMSIMREYSLCYVRSNAWPGAFTLGHARNYFNLYVGWGQKYEQFNPSQPSPPEIELKKQFIEQNDPTVELEKAMEEVQHEAASDLMSEEYATEEEDNEEIFTDEEY
ncbi:unnamed protein product [Rotaria sordida]|uniref:Uncharacterized protein n=1 Tax=Rotaria sordida TaxID=392033 RepID=A0A814QDC7_9BILA|nr:unnamed protein product [Rotaria sordida]CAF3814679.1 unnamed protein product [Rotaria sordida]